MKNSAKAVLGILVAAMMMLSLVACGGSASDPLKGTWEGTHEDGEATWTFDGKGGCTLTNYFRENMPGTYTIKGDDVEIKINDWEKAIVYHFKIDGDNLTLEADNDYSPNYQLKKK